MVSIPILFLKYSLCARGDVLYVIETLKIGTLIIPSCHSMQTMVLKIKN